MSSCHKIVEPWWHAHPPVGAFIAVLALLGVLVPLFREWGKISRAERAVWTLAMFALVGLELRTLYLDRSENDQEQAFARCQQLEKFKSIGQQLQDAIRRNKDQFTATMSSEKIILAKTRAAAQIAEKGLNVISGGNSYCYVTPEAVMYSGPYTLLLSNAGNEPLTGISVTLGLMTEGGSNHLIVMNPMVIGTLGPHDSTLLQNPIAPRTAIGGTAHYTIFVSAQNGTSVEEIWFRPSKNGVGSAYKFVVRRQYRRHIQILRSVDWTEPKPLAQP